MNNKKKQNEDIKDKRRYDPELLKKGLRCDLDQYEMLMHCSEKEEMTEWNKWRLKNPTQDILLEGAEFSFFCLRNASFNQQTHNKKETKKTSQVSFKEASFISADLINSRLTGANLEKARLVEACLDKASLRGTRLKGVLAYSTHFENADLRDADLDGAVIQGAYLQGACINSASLKGANCHLVHVDESTIIWKCKVDHHTDFSGVNLDGCQIDPSTKQLLEYNIRRKSWEDWYKKHPILKWQVLWFWCVSNYGISTWRIIGWFFGLALFFAAIYSFFAFLSPPGIVSNLEIESHLPLWHYFMLLLLRPIYFSVVTMTTLGFGDMYANAQSILGHIFLTFQVILGYVLLGALVTRFAVLFTAGGPAVKFVDEE